MAFKVKAFSEILTMSKEQLDEALAPIRARSTKAKADVASSKLEEKMISLERQIHEACADKDIDFDKVIKLIDDYELTERKFNQIRELIEDLFPEG